MPKIPKRPTAANLHGWDDEKVYFYSPETGECCVSDEPALLNQLIAICADYYGAQQEGKPKNKQSTHPSALPPLIKQAIDARLNRYCEERVPEHLRDQIRLLFKVRGRNVTLFESRPFWKDPTQWVDSKTAQFRYDLETGTWALYCADRNGRWHRYDPQVPSKDFDDLLQEVERDPTGIFWG